VQVGLKQKGALESGGTHSAVRINLYIPIYWCQDQVFPQGLAPRACMCMLICDRPSIEACKPTPTHARPLQGGPCSKRRHVSFHLFLQWSLLTCFILYRIRIPMYGEGLEWVLKPYGWGQGPAGRSSAPSKRAF